MAFPLTVKVPVDGDRLYVRPWPIQSPGSLTIDSEVVAAVVLTVSGASSAVVYESFTATGASFTLATLMVTVAVLLTPMPSRSR